ncbi:hypothetical protein BH23BAC1_BH23BAC1_21340 [soil metagenome]
MIKQITGCILFLLFINTSSFSQIFSDTTIVDKQTLDSLYIAEVEERKEPAKILHAEPLYIDLIRDLGARKGEREWNIGLGITDRLRFDSYEALIEYEWAPINRLGLEVEVPFTIYTRYNGVNRDSIPSNRMESLKLAFQYTFLVSEKLNTSLAIGYINELEFTDLERIGDSLFQGNIYNPFFIAAKRWGNNIHTLVYTGPRFQNHFHHKGTDFSYEINTNFHYMISGTRNFIGLEVNKQIYSHDFDLVLRPQMRLGISESLMIGIVAGIPMYRENERLSSFIRLIYEPRHN